MLSLPPLNYGENFFPKKVFYGGTFWTNLCRENLKVFHWCVNGDVGSYPELGASLSKRIAWKAGGRRKLFMVSCHSYI